MVGVPDDTWGETLSAFVVLTPDASVARDELRVFYRAHLAHDTTPRSFTFIPEGPKTATGKIQKHAIRGGRPRLSRR